MNCPLLNVDAQRPEALEMPFNNFSNKRRSQMHFNLILLHSHRSLRSEMFLLIKISVKDFITK